MKNNAFAAIIFLISVLAVAAQQTIDPGIQLYKDGRYKDAVKSLSNSVKTKENEKNAELWNYLGLASIRTNDLKQAKKALEKSDQIQAGKLIISSKSCIYVPDHRAIRKSARRSKAGDRKRSKELDGLQFERLSKPGRNQAK